MIPADVYGIDFLVSYPEAQLLADRGVRFVACYLKNWKPVKVEAYLAKGIGVIPIGEVAANSAAMGASMGALHANRWVTAAQQFGIPANNTVPIIMTNDTSAWSAEHLAYFKAAEPIIRRAGYLYGGYGSRQMFDECMAAGIVWDLMWATNAYAWGGGRHPDAHVFQGGHKNITSPTDFLWCDAPLDVTGMGSVDTNASRRAFPAWLTKLEPIPTQENDMPVVVTNKEVFFTSAPNVAKFVIRESDGKLRHIAEPEWQAMGSPAGFPFTNAQIVAQGVWTADATPAVPVVYPTNLTLTMTGQGKLT